MLTQPMRQRVALPGKQALADQGRQCYYGRLCQAGRICYCVSALGRVHHMAVGGFCVDVGHV